MAATQGAGRGPIEEHSAEVCVVPASGEVWPFYLRHGLFVTSANKFFRTVPRYAFYTSRLVRPVAPQVLEVFESIRLEDELIAALSLSADSIRRRMGNALAETAENTLSDEPVKLVLLTTPDDPRTVRFGEIEHSGRGAWVKTRRYVRLGQLMDALVTTDIADGGEL